MNCRRMLTKLVLCAAIASLLGACTTSVPIVAMKGNLIESTRGIVGTSLIGAVGKTDADQDKIDDTVAGLCGAGVYTKMECLAHRKLE